MEFMLCPILEKLPDCEVCIKKSCDKESVNVMGDCHSQLGGRWSRIELTGVYRPSPHGWWSVVTGQYRAVIGATTDTDCGETHWRGRTSPDTTLSKTRVDREVCGVSQTQRD
ncbi:hypothetical protein Dimus_009780 [Dionaea muscipula]